MVINEKLSQEEKRVLLKLAREALVLVVCGQELPELDLTLLSPHLVEDGVCFVTLTVDAGRLRGCIGGLEATRPLALDVRDHAAAAALEDYRFQPVRPAELDQLKIEISVLSRPIPVEYDDPQALPGLLRPGVDGVVLRDDQRRATFLPQVWEKIPDARDFLSQLCEKMGGPAKLWQQKKLIVEVYQIEEFHE